MQLEIGEFFDSFDDALRAVVKALGGYKAVGVRMRPELPMEQAKDWVRHCLDASRRERFTPDQVLWLLREARQVGFHAAMDFLAADTGYQASPVDVQAQVQSIEASIASTLEDLNRRVAHLTKLRERAAG